MNQYRLALITALALAAGCDKASKNGSGTAEAAPTPAKTAPAPAPAVSAPKPAQFTPPKETVTATKALDFELVESGKSFRVRDSAYEISFPARPDVASTDQIAPSGVKLKTATAMYASDNDVYGFFIIPIPKGVPYDVNKGLTGARDGALNNIGGKIISEGPATLGTLKGKHTLGAATFQGKKLSIDLFLAWDEGHRTLVAMFTATDQAAATQLDKDFIASFKVDPAGKSPPAGDGK